MTAHTDGLASNVIPFSLKDAPSFIEIQFPVGRISAEAYKERKAIHGQVLTSLGSYWKGRKPLILVRAALLGVLLPATNAPLQDLEIFLALMGMDDAAFAKRIKTIKPSQIDKEWDGYISLIEEGEKPKWRTHLSKEQRNIKIAEWLITLPYAKRLSKCFRPSECQEILQEDIWDKVNQHLGTSSFSLSDLVSQLGVMRYGHTPRAADTFSGGGSIPFEASRLGFKTTASDVNPIACLLTWGAFNVVGGTIEARASVSAAQRTVVAEILKEYKGLGVETGQDGARAKSYLYCVEVRCPKTGYMVPLAPSWIISHNKRVVAKLTPRVSTMDYEIVIITDASDKEMLEAESGTLVEDQVVHAANPNRDGVSLAVIRGDHKTSDGVSANKIRLWDQDDILPHPGDIFQERLYCIEWSTISISDDLDDEDNEDEENAPTLQGKRGLVWFAAPTEFDFQQETRVEELVRNNLAEWQRDGYVPKDPIERGEKTDEPIRTRGWTYWHHLFAPRHLLFGAVALKAIDSLKTSIDKGTMLIGFCRCLNYMSRLTQWLTRKKPENAAGGFADVVNHVFYNQALNTFYNFGARTSMGLVGTLAKTFPSAPVTGEAMIENISASEAATPNDIFITDPPYADAVAYHEITEYFLMWAKSIGNKAFPEFNWNPTREVAIKGSDEKFRSEMVFAYRRMTENLASNGSQVVMFTHQDAGVWADLAAIMWAAGLRVTAAWNVVTETESSTKKGNYVKGTILLVLRKREIEKNIKRMDIEGIIEDEVGRQLSSLNALDNDWTSENLYNDGDLQLAAYAAALRVITNYATIDRKDVGADVYRKLGRNEKTVVRELIEYASSVANNKLVPEGFSKSMWRDLDVGSRFYVRMLDMEAKGSTRYSDYADFARTFSFTDYARLMNSTKANAASLAGSATLKGAFLGGEGFGSSHLRRILFATFKTIQKDDPKEGLAFLKTEYGPEYWSTRPKLVEISRYLAIKTAKTRSTESQAADLISQRLEVDRL